MRSSRHPPCRDALSTPAATTPAASATPAGTVGRLDDGRSEIAELLHQLDLERLLERGGPRRYRSGFGRSATAIGAVTRIRVVASRWAAAA
ncbi:MAG: hypothetical protein ABSF33_13495, partial [Acidimicrobiales bacterium]